MAVAVEWPGQEAEKPHFHEPLGPETAEILASWSREPQESLVELAALIFSKFWRIRSLIA
jgi:hypothetical protein